jgi:broad specificity phosphatase PhoE
VGQILLVRHGQASFGAADYDVLSPVGEQQARATGAALRTLRPDVVVHGVMQRQRRTAELIAEAAGWDVVLTVEQAWDEFDHLAMLDAQPQDYDGQPDERQVQAWFEKATRRWLSGDHDADYAESWPDFRDRVLAGLGALGDGTTVVVTSGGPISIVVAHLLASPAAYERIAPVVVNASLTKVVLGSRGRTLVSFNEHGHLPSELLTYR